MTNFHQITSIFYMLLEDSFGVKSFSRQSLVCFEFLWADSIKSDLCYLVGYMTRYL